MTDDMTTRSQEVLEEQNSPIPTQSKVDPKDKKRWEQFKSRAEICKQYRTKLVQNWMTSIDMRKGGKSSNTQSDDEQISVNPDWSLTKTKQASLFSQVPQVRVSHPPQSSSAGPWLAAYETKLNDSLIQSGIESAMDECLPDCINAAGFGVVLVSYEALTEDKEVPAIDLSMLPPELHAQVLETGMIGGVEVPMEVVPQVVDKRYLIQRLSPSDLLWPINFTGSNFDNAPWIGRSGRITWAEALQRGWVKPEDKDDVLGEDKTVMDKLNQDIEKEKLTSDQNVGFDEIFYKEQQYHPESKSFSTYHHLVFVTGKDEPVVDEPWKGQRILEDGTVIGSLKCPVRVLTLTYISDEAIPPSDSAIGRPQVNEIVKIRNLDIKQRERNIPVRWFDVNRVDPALQSGLMRGTWQNMIPVQGDGTRIIGEVAKSGHPTENGLFHQLAQRDLAEAWTIGPNQTGSGADVETKGESQEIAKNFQTREGRERAKVASFFVGIAEVLGGLICLYEDPTAFGEGFDPAFSKSLSFSVLADSTLLLDANQKLQRLDSFLNKYAKSGWVVLEPILKEIAILSGIDPNTGIKAPEPKPPVEPNISLRLTGAEDMMNPLLLAFMLQSGQAPKAELIEEAKKLIQQAVAVPGPNPIGPDGMPLAPPIPPPGSPVDVPPPAPTPVGEANPNLTVLPKIAKRSDDPSAGGKED
jgi:hypothetical protein